MLGDPSVQIRFVEGIKKADALASRGCCAVASTGGWGCKGKNPLGGTTMPGDFDYIALKGRECDIIYDSDYADNPSVRKAAERLTEHLWRKGASKLNSLYLPRRPAWGEDRRQRDVAWSDALQAFYNYPAKYRSRRKAEKLHRLGSLPRTAKTRLR